MTGARGTLSSALLVAEMVVVWRPDRALQACNPVSRGSQERAIR